MALLSHLDLWPSFLPNKRTAPLRLRRLEPRRQEYSFPPTTYLYTNFLPLEWLSSSTSRAGTAKKHLLLIDKTKYETKVRKRYTKITPIKNCDQNDDNENG
tara:strand:- start:1354 stop:1656 length:303 start_codon:yes stop_codon:yes gene_type:complete